MICDFMSFSTVFQLYQNDWKVIVKECEERNPDEKISASIGNQTETTGSASLHLAH